jgi:hypothetical protein
MDLSKWQTYDATKEKQDKSDKYNDVKWRRERDKEKEKGRKKKNSTLETHYSSDQNMWYHKKTCRDNFKDTKKGHQRS